MKLPRVVVAPTTHNPRGTPNEERPEPPQVDEALERAADRSLRVPGRKILPRKTRAAVIAAVPCPDCGAPVGKGCTAMQRKPPYTVRPCGPHAERVRAWWALPRGGR